MHICKRITWQWQIRSVEAMVRGYHEYKRIWDVTLVSNYSVGVELTMHDLFAVAVLKSRVVVGHDLFSVFSVFTTRWNDLLRSYRC